MTETINHQINNTSKKEGLAQFSQLKKIKAKICLGLGLLSLASSLTSCDSFAEHMAQDDFFTGPKDNSPMVLEGQRIFAEQENEATEDPTPLATHEAFEVPATDQRILPGSRVRVIETGGIGLNIRSEAGVDAQLVATAQDGDVFKVVSLAGEKDGYSWVLVKQEVDDGEREIVGYAASDWFQVLKDEPIQ